MYESADPQLLFEWFRYYELEPFGEQRADFRLAILDQIVVNALGGHSKLEDFIPEFDIEKIRKDNEQSLKHFEKVMKKRYG